MFVNMGENKTNFELSLENTQNAEFSSIIET